MRGAGWQTVAGLFTAVRLAPRSHRHGGEGGD
jgi:hypothetical protein